MNAAGPWAKPLAASAGLDLPLRVGARAGHGVAGAGRPRGAEDVGLDGRRCLLLPAARRQGRFIIGRGFPKEYVDVDPYNYKTSADADFISDVQTRVERRFPAFAGMKLIEAYAALYDVTPDWYPFVGPRAGTRRLRGLLRRQRTWLQDRAGDRPRARRLAADRQGRRRLPPVQPRPHRARRAVRAILRREQRVDVRIPLVPAKAGTQGPEQDLLDSRLRGNERRGR